MQLSDPYQQQKSLFPWYSLRLLLHWPGYLSSTFEQAEIARRFRPFRFGSGHVSSLHPCAAPHNFSSLSRSGGRQAVPPLADFCVTVRMRLDLPFTQELQGVHSDSWQAAATITDDNICLICLDYMPHNCHKYIREGHSALESCASVTDLILVQ